MGRYQRIESGDRNLELAIPGLLFPSLGSISRMHEQVNGGRVRFS